MTTGIWNKRITERRRVLDTRLKLHRPIWTEDRVKVTRRYRGLKLATEHFHEKVSSVAFRRGFRRGGREKTRSWSCLPCAKKMNLFVQ
ncbi:hypothetical protein K443DRAFT_240011 [Laccaria amethystina LaAM-08-1]|uniref:Uncharacterized protein n=1 Tax=Laccaria amethystina LaAM-08-1 TaxID=1095629 RepID=A0A0C9XJ28_9AGAR|nr:hypothetical protein K443DRAFT_240011 [Laccaria amethystina LaAM-08-1]